MSFATITASVALALSTVTGPIGPVVLVGGPTAVPVPDAASTHLARSDDDDDDDHDYGKCVGKKRPPKFCYEGLYVPPAIGGDQPGQLTPYPGYVSSSPGELVAPLGGGYVATSPGVGIPPVGGGYVSSPPGVAISPVG